VSLVEVRTNEVQANRQAIYQAAGHRYAGQSGEIRTDRVDVVEVHRDRVIGLVAELEGGCRRCWPGNDVDIRKGLPEIASNQLPYLLSLEVVRIVVACR
jgi:hypothetical protein